MKLYNFWDRIGDTIAYYSELEIPEHQVSFPLTIDKLKQDNRFKNSDNFNWIKKFRENEFKEFNIQRREVVHYYQFETTYQHEFVENNSNEDEIKKLWEWKKNMPDYFKKHLKLSCDGFAETYKLIKNLPNIANVDGIYCSSGYVNLAPLFCSF